MAARGTNLEKAFWPEAGLTKGDFLEYLDAVAGPMVAALRNRPLTLKRFPDGIHGFSFFQKNTPQNAPSFVQTVTLRAETAKRNVRYAVCNSKRTLMWLGNQAAIEFHPWISRRDRVDRPDQLVFDFDPPEGGFRRAAEAAALMGELLKEERLEGAVKTSGSKGVHVYVPIRRRYGHGQVMEAADRLAARLEDQAPQLVTTEFAKAGRGGRVLIDTRRNAPGQHVVVAFSPRARPEATVSFPVAWADLDSVRAEDFTIRSVPKLVDGRGDPWRELLPAAQALPRSVLGD